MSVAVKTSTNPDFPEWMDAMVVKEFRQALRESLFLVPFVAIHLFMLGALALEWHSLQSEQNSFGMSFESRLARNAFWWCSFCVVGILMPLRSFNALREEAMATNSELLIMGGLSRWRIVRGKFLAQSGLQILVIASLLPYLMVRYFFGAFDFWANVIELVSLIGFSCAASALVIGVSGYANYFTRIALLSVGFLWLSITGLISSSLMSMTSRLVGSISALSLILGLPFLLGFHCILALIGLQLGRGHLKLYLLKWETSPTRSMANMLVFAPFILLAGSVATCGYGGIVVEAVMIHSLFKFDRKYEG